MVNNGNVWGWDNSKAVTTRLSRQLHPMGGHQPDLEDLRRLMLFDLTRMSDTRVIQVDELRADGHIWMRSTELFLSLGDEAIGVLFRPFISSWPTYTGIPRCALAVWFRFHRKRSVVGGINPPALR